MASARLEFGEKLRTRLDFTGEAGNVLIRKIERSRHRAAGPPCGRRREGRPAVSASRGPMCPFRCLAARQRCSPFFWRQPRALKSVGQGKRVSVSLELGG